MNSLPTLPEDFSQADAASLGCGIDAVHTVVVKVLAGSYGCQVISRTRRNPFVYPLILILCYGLERQNEEFCCAEKQEKKKRT